MVYLDYSATTPVNSEVLNSFNKVCNNYLGNANSLHQLGIGSNELMKAATKQVSELLGVKENEIIFTSGASESNNLAIFGTINHFPNRGKHIITTPLEHSSVLEPLKYLQKKGYIIDYVALNDDGTVNIDDFKRLMTKDTILVSICEVNSEIGLYQDVDTIGKIVKEYPQCYFHVDGTQAFGKKKINLANIDMYSISAHKIYGLKGIGLLVKKENVQITPLIMGGKSQSIYRAGTPPLPLIVSMAKAMKLMMVNFDNQLEKVIRLREHLINKLKTIKGIIINSNHQCVPHIINVSLINIKPETMLHALDNEEIYLSTKTACSNNDDYSLSVFSLTKDMARAKTSLRISLSYLTTYDEIDYFIKIFSEKIKELKELGDHDE